MKGLSCTDQHCSKKTYWATHDSPLHRFLQIFLPTTLKSMNSNQTRSRNTALNHNTCVLLTIPNSTRFMWIVAGVEQSTPPTPAMKTRFISFVPTWTDISNTIIIHLQFSRYCKQSNKRNSLNHAFQPLFLMWKAEKTVPSQTKTQYPSASQDIIHTNSNSNPKVYHNSNQGCKQEQELALPYNKSLLIN